MKFLILDVDGVINSHGMRGLDADKLDMIAEIVSATGCLICLSSTWRRIPDQSRRLYKELEKRGVDIDHETPILDSQSGSIFTAKTRTDEIECWLVSARRIYTITALVILDDDPSCEIYGPLAAYLVKTDTYTGLTPELAQEVIKRLNFPLPNDRHHPNTPDT
jgi:hypothetical protein